MDSNNTGKLQKGEKEDPQTVLRQRIFSFFDELRRETNSPKLLGLLADWEGE
jgi:hypothetical protein